MGVLKCICGNLLYDTCGPDGEAFSEIQLDENNKYEAGKGRGILECEKCGAISIENPINSCYVIYYIPENKQYNGLFKNID